MQSTSFPSRDTRPTLRASAIVLAISLACTASAIAAGPGDGRLATLARPTALHPGDAVIGALRMDQPMHVEVALRIRDREKLDTFIASRTRAPAGAPAQPMTSDAFLARHAPTALQAQAVADYLGHMGFRNIVIAPNRLLVSADGTAQTARDAFATSFAQVRTQDGRVAYANNDDVRFPAALADSVLAVLGLQTVRQAHTTALRAVPDAAHTLAITTHHPAEFEAIYGASGYDPASDITVGLVTAGNLTQVTSDLNAYTTKHGLPAIATQTVATNGTSSDITHVGTWDLESQSIVGMAGGRLGKLVFYNVPNLGNANLVADFNAVVLANKAKIIAVSMSECETDVGPAGDHSAAAADQVFAAGAAQGQSFGVATGDIGADECGDGGTKPGWPANSPYVIAVAGTRLDATKTTWNNEIVWNTLGTSGGGATGGSQSTYEPKPSWQTAWTGSLRGVADVAYDANPASGALIIVNGVEQPMGGTALAASLFAGFWARILHYNPTIGFAGPILYPMQDGGFSDVTSGNNSGSPARTGYDLASGRGSTVFHIFNTAIYFQHLGHQRPTASFTYASSGRTASFTDVSTAKDGAPIATHAWNFGDGATSTQAHPVHAYAADGTYSVTETIHDGVGSAASRTLLVTVAAGNGPLQLLGNPGFENGTSPWVLSDAASVKCTNISYPAHSGNCDALLDDSLNQPSGALSQWVAIPGGKTSATLTFDLAMLLRGTTHDPQNQLRVQLLDQNGAVVRNLATYADTDGSSTYRTRTFNLTPYIGQTVNLRFSGTAEQLQNRAGYQIDDVNLIVQ